MGEERGIIALRRELIVLVGSPANVASSWMRLASRRR